MLGRYVGDLSWKSYQRCAARDIDYYAFTELSGISSDRDVESEIRLVEHDFYHCSGDNQHSSGIDLHDSIEVLHVVVWHGLVCCSVDLR